MTKKINITYRELDRDIRNLFMPLEDQHIPYVPLEDLNCYSEKVKEEIRKAKDKNHQIYFDDRIGIY